MAFNLSSFGDALNTSKTDNDEKGVSFAGFAKKWENEEDGKRKNVNSISTFCEMFFIFILQLKNW